MADLLMPACGCTGAAPCPIAAVLFKGGRWRTTVRLHLEYALQRAAALRKGDLRFHPVRRPGHMHVYQPGEAARSGYPADLRYNRRAK